MMNSSFAAAALAFSVTIPGTIAGGTAPNAQDDALIVSPVNSGVYDNPMLNILEPMVEYDVRSASLREMESEEVEGETDTGLHEIILGVNDLDGTDAEVDSLTVLTADMLEQIMETPDALVLNRWMIIEREEGSVSEVEETEVEESGSEDYSWVWSTDVLAYGDVVEDMLVSEDGDHTVAIDFAEHVDSDFGDELKEPGEYSLVVTSDVQELGYVFGIVDFDLEEQGEGFEMLSFFSPDSADPASVSYELIEDVEEDIDDAEPHPMPIVDDESGDNGWIALAGVITAVVLAVALAGLLWWQRFSYRRERHIAEDD